MAESTLFQPQPRTRRPGTYALPADGPVNVGDGERWLSLLGGGILALYTLRRSLGTVVLACGAAALLYRGLRGQCALYQTMGISTMSHDVASPDEPADCAGGFLDPWRGMLAWGCAVARPHTSAVIRRSTIAQEGIKPLEEKALGVQLFREDRETESEFVTISY